MAVDLPDDILHLLCVELALQRDFDTLFSCCASGKRFAVPALKALYRSQHLSPVISGGSEAAPLAEQQQVVQKWSILWRSIIASSLGHTLFPYCQYLKVLDLRDLSHLIEDPKFRGQVAESFFAGEFAEFDIALEPETKSKRIKVRRWNVVAIVNAIGEVVTQHTPMLEQISGNLVSSALIRWIPRLPHLRSLELWEGEALQDERIQHLVHINCPEFNSLSVLYMQAENADQIVSRFLSGIRPQSLRFFETISDVRLGVESCLSLNEHSQTLRELKLSLRDEILPCLALLKGCTTLETLQLTDVHHRTDLERTQNDVFLEVIAWLRKCKNLKDLGFIGFVSAAAIVKPLLLEEQIRLRRLQVDHYMVHDHRDFHLALTHQPALQTLRLKGDGETGIFRDDLDVMVNSIAKLKELRELEFIEVSDMFSEDHILHLTNNLEKLEELYIGGLKVTDKVLEGLAGLRNLRNLTIVAMSSFTLGALLDFVHDLGPGNRNMVFSVDMADPGDYLDEQEQAMVREAMAAQAGGRFEYTLWRDPEISSYEGESD